MTYCRMNLRHSLIAIMIAGLSLLSITSDAQSTSASKKTGNNVESPGNNTSSDSKVRDIDGVAAVVNTGFITRKEIDDRIVTLQKQGAKLPSDVVTLRKAILERLIIEKVQIQEAEQNGISVSEKELAKIVDDIAARNKTTLAEFKAKIIASGMSFERYKEMLRNDIMMSRYREREVESKIKISDAEVDNFIAEQSRGRGGAVRPIANTPSAAG